MEKSLTLSLFGGEDESSRLCADCRSDWRFAERNPPAKGGRMFSQCERSIADATPWTIGVTRLKFCRLDTIVGDCLRRGVRFGSGATHHDPLPMQGVRVHSSLPREADRTLRGMLPRFSHGDVRRTLYEAASAMRRGSEARTS